MNQETQFLMNESRDTIIKNRFGLMGSVPMTSTESIQKVCGERVNKPFRGSWQIVDGSTTFVVDTLYDRTTVTVQGDHGRVLSWVKLRTTSWHKIIFR